MTTLNKSLEETSVDNLVPFKLSQPEYDQSTFTGRFMHLLKVQNPLNTFLTRRTIEKAQQVIANQKELEASKTGESYNLLPPSRVHELRAAQYAVSSSVHPDTNEILPFYQRFCSYSIVNIPILFGMILMKQTTGTIVFWQWVNQTYNAALNYSNRNASSSLDLKGLSLAYSGAVTASITIGLGMRKILTPFTKSVKGPGQLFFNFLINCTAIGCAGVLNVMIMRSKEIKEGITLTDKDGNEYGKSKMIGKSAVYKTAASRLILPIPPLLLPTLAFYVMEKRNIVPKNKGAKLLTESGIFFASLAFAPPLCCAIFEQTSKVNANELESEFHNLKDANGNSVTELYYNKGL